MNIKKRRMEITSDRVHSEARAHAYKDTRAHILCLTHYIHALFNTYFCASICAVLEGAVLDPNQNLGRLPLLLKPSATYNWSRTTNYIAYARAKWRIVGARFLCLLSKQ
jgi:hypothetical protein